MEGEGFASRVATLLMLATRGSRLALRHDDHSPEELDRQRALDRSWKAAQALSDPAMRAYLESAIERVDGSNATPVTGDEFLSRTESAET